MLAEDAPLLALEPAAAFVVLAFTLVEAFAPLDFFVVSFDFAEDLPPAVFAAAPEVFDFEAAPADLLEPLADLLELPADLPEAPVVLLFDEADEPFALDAVPALFDEADEPFVLTDVPADLVFDEAPPFFDFDEAPALLAFEPEDFPFCPVAPFEPVTASANPLAAPTAAPVAALVKTSAATSFTFLMTFVEVDFFDALFAVDFLLESFLPFFFAGIIFLL